MTVLLHGISAIILGAMLLTAPVKTVILLITFLGFYWLIAGVILLVQSVSLTIWAFRIRA